MHMLRTAKSMIKSALDSIHKWRREAEIKQTERHVTRAELAVDLKKLGIAAGDTVFIHSSLKSLGYVEGGPAAVIGALQDVVGQEGSLLLPTYYMPGGTILGTCMMSDYVFDPRVHGSNMGALPKAFLDTPGVRRTIHPTHSVSAIGKHAEYLTEAHHLAPSVFGKGSPWQRFLELEGKVLGLGISMGPVTFYHLLEDSMGDDFPLPVWIDKVYRLPCYDHDGNPCEVPVRPYDPEIVKQRIDQKIRADLREYFWQEFEAAGLLVSGQVGIARAWYIPARGFFDHLKELSGQGITVYATESQLAARPIPSRN